MKLNKPTNFSFVAIPGGYQLSFDAVTHPVTTPPPTAAPKPFVYEVTFSEVRTGPSRNFLLKQQGRTGAQMTDETSYDVMCDHGRPVYAFVRTHDDQGNKSDYEVVEMSVPQPTLFQRFMQEWWGFRLVKKLAWVFLALVLILGAVVVCKKFLREPIAAAWHWAFGSSAVAAVPPGNDDAVLAGIPPGATLSPDGTQWLVERVSRSSVLSTQVLRYPVQQRAPAPAATHGAGGVTINQFFGVGPNGQPLVQTQTLGAGPTDRPSPQGTLIIPSTVKRRFLNEPPSIEIAAGETVILVVGRGRSAVLDRATLTQHQELGVKVNGIDRGQAAANANWPQADVDGNTAVAGSEVEIHNSGNAPVVLPITYKP